MSILGSLNTGVLGLTAQSRALGHISDNIANASTVGYKRVDTSFETLVLRSSPRFHDPGGVRATPKFANTIQGSVSQSQFGTNIAIQGQGFFNVTPLSQLDNADEGNLAGGGVTTQSNFYTRVGDFELNKDRYLVNSAGFALNGFSIDNITGETNEALSQPIQITQLVDPPIATSGVEFTANLPANPPSGTTLPTQSVQIFDAEGTQRSLDLTFRRQGDVYRLGLFDGNTSILGSNFQSTADPDVEKKDIDTEGQAAQAQVDVFTIGSGTGTLPRVGDIYAVTIDNQTFSVEITEDNIDDLGRPLDIAEELASLINKSNLNVRADTETTGISGPLPFAEPQAALIVEGATKGQAFSSEIAVENRIRSPSTTTTTVTASNPTVTIAFDELDIDIGDTIQIDIGNDSDNNNIVSIQATVTAADVADGLASFVQEKIAEIVTLDPDINIDAEVNGDELTLSSTDGGNVVVAAYGALTAGAYTTADHDTGATIWVNDTSSMGDIDLEAEVVKAQSGEKRSQPFTISSEVVGDVGVEYIIEVTEPTQQQVLRTDGTEPSGNLSARLRATVNAVQAGVNDDRTIDLSGTTVAEDAEYTIVIDGTEFTYTATSTDTDSDDIATGLAAVINGTAPYSGGAGTTAAGSVITIDEGAGQLDISAPNTFDFAQTIAQTPISAGVRYHLTVNDIDYSLQITEENITDYASAEDIRDYFREEISKNDDRVTVSNNGTDAIDITVTNNFQQFSLTQNDPPDFESVGPITYTTDGTETSVEDIAARIAETVNGEGGGVVASASGNEILITAAQAGGAGFVLDVTDGGPGETPPYIELVFGDNDDPSVAGTLTSLSTANAGGTVVGPGATTEGSPVDVTFTHDFGAGEQTIELNLGRFRTPGGLTQYAGEQIEVISVQQNGSPVGQFQEAQVSDSGRVQAIFDNGRIKDIAQIPLVLFNNPNALSRESGGIFLETEDSGVARFSNPDNNGAGKVIASSLEGSNVDIADEFTKLIVTQRTYTANTRIITTADQMLQDAIGLVR